MNLLRHVKPLKLCSSEFGGAHASTTLFVLHALLSSKAGWGFFLPALEESFRDAKLDLKIIALDARNHGSSPHSNVHRIEAMVADVLHFCNLGSRVKFLTPLLITLKTLPIKCFFLEKDDGVKLTGNIVKLKLQ